MEEAKVTVMYSFSQKSRIFASCIYAVLILLVTSAPMLADDQTLSEQFGKLWAKKDYEAIYNLIEPRAQNGDKRAESILGTMYQLGLFVRQDEDKAVFWYDRAANQGVPGAQYYLGRILLKRAVEAHSDPSVAIGWLETAANNHLDLASHALASFYEEGYGVEKSAEKAAYWLKRAEADTSPAINEIMKRIKRGQTEATLPEAKN